MGGVGGGGGGLWGWGGLGGLGGLFIPHIDPHIFLRKRTEWETWLHKKSEQGIGKR